MDWATRIEQHSPQGIAAAIARMIRSGELGPGDRLPTVRVLASELGISPATVSGAWQALAGVGLIGSRGRAGTHVLPQPTAWMPPRYRGLAPAAETYRLDLGSGTPDPALLPALAPALARLAGRTQAADTNSYLGPPLIEPLEAVLRRSWPYRVQRLTVVDGALDAMSRTLEQVVGFGDRVAVEDPGFPPLFDLLDSLGLERVPVGMDGHGMRPDLLQLALSIGVGAVVLQPRAQNPTGVSTSSTRARDLARVVRNHPGAARVHVIEDDHSGEIAAAPDVSLGKFLPDRVVRVRSYSKSHGPDLRIAAVGGPAVVLDALVSRRMLGPGWTSRMLQSVLADLLTDADAVATVDEARRTYAARQRRLAAALTRHGVPMTAGDGINLWLPVADVQAAVVHLAASGIRVAPGTPFVASGAVPSGPSGHVRVTVGQVGDDADEVGRALAAAALA